MFSVEIKINGSMIIHIYGRNAGEMKSNKIRYKYELYRVESKKVISGVVYNAPGEGIEKLIVKIIENTAIKANL